jgi:succinate dehydrogenase / fumarate reductase iron-sulfur subunit
MNLKLKVWRQKNREAAGQLVEYEARDVSPDMSFLEMLDVVNEGLIAKGEEPIAFDHDCREGICGSCGVMINGAAHGPLPGLATCQLHMRHFKDGDAVIVEPWRARAFPVLRDLCVDRGAFDRIIQAGGFVSAKVSHLGLLPQGQPERYSRVSKMVAVMEQEAFGSCTNYGECEAVCPKEISIDFIARMNRDYLKAKVKGL